MKLGIIQLKRPLQCIYYLKLISFSRCLGLNPTIHGWKVGGISGKIRGSWQLLADRVHQDAAVFSNIKDDDRSDVFVQRPPGIDHELHFLVALE